MPAVLCAISQLSKHGLVISCSMFCLVKMASKLAIAFVPECIGKVPVQSARPAFIPKLFRDLEFVAVQLALGTQQLVLRLTRSFSRQPYASSQTSS